MQSISQISNSLELQTKAIRWSQDIIEALNYVGVICIEFFIDRFDNLYVNEVTLFVEQWLLTFILNSSH